MCKTNGIPQNQLLGCNWKTDQVRDNREKGLIDRVKRQSLDQIKMENK